MDTFLDSSWYFLRYPDAGNDEQVFAPEKVNDWLPVDQYVGGIEHAILHLLYSRFFTKVLRDRGLLNFDEPFKKLLTQGMVQAMAYKNPITGKYFAAEDLADPNHPVDPKTGDALVTTYEKMSKSKFNGVAPSDVVDKYGADTARMFILFKAPPEKDLEWDDADVEGQFRFLNRVWRTATAHAENGGRTNGDSSLQGDLTKPEKALRRAIHTAIQAITEDLEGDYQFNTAVSELMKLNNALGDAKDILDSAIYNEGVETLLRLLAPFSPHLAEDLWHSLGYESSIHREAWPKSNPQAFVVDEITLVVQVMGKTRGTIQVPASSDKATLEQLARESDVAQKFMEGKTVKKVIVVPGKLVNFVVA